MHCVLPRSIPVACVAAASTFFLIQSVYGDGACCMPDGVCTVETDLPACVAVGGSYQGNGTDCVDIDCGVPATVLHVDADAAPGGDGLSWTTALNDLQRALEIGRRHPSIVRETWVKEGDYTPAAPEGDREQPFRLRISGQALYGGFDGTETERSERDPVGHPTTLSGDLNGDDGPGFAGNGENSYHVVETENTGACVFLKFCVDGLTAAECEAIDGSVFLGYGTSCVAMDVDPMIVDGFTITAGNADEGDRRGGGVRNVADQFELGQCRVTANSATLRGGGMFDSGVATVVVNCDFIGNRTFVTGGGLSTQGSFTPSITSCRFEANTADAGGGAYASIGSNPTYTDCTFASNTAGIGGAIYIEESGALAHVTLTGCLITTNEAFADGGGVYLEDGTSLTTTDCDVVGNIKGGIRNLAGNLTISGGTFDSNEDDGAIWTLGHLVDDNVWLDGVTFTGNECNAGGGAIRLVSGGAVVTGCDFTSNTSPASGGAIYLQVGSRMRLYNCAFIGNSATEHGGGMYSQSVNPTVTNCSFATNDAARDGGGMYNSGAAPILTGSVLYHNTDQNGTGESSQLFGGAPTVNYSCVQGWTGGLGGVGNIGDDPQFVDPDNGNYHLSSGSPCIDAADNDAVPEGVTEDLDGNPRFVDDPCTKDTGCGKPPIVDMGAYEFQPPCPPDLDCSGAVDFADILAILGAWGQVGGPEDLDGSGFVDFGDILVVLGAWGPCE